MFMVRLFLSLFPSFQSLSPSSVRSALCDASLISASWSNATSLPPPPPLSLFLSLSRCVCSRPLCLTNGRLTAKKGPQPVTGHLFSADGHLVISQPTEVPGSSSSLPDFSHVDFSVDVISMSSVCSKSDNEGNKPGLVSPLPLSFCPSPFHRKRLSHH